MLFLLFQLGLDRYAIDARELVEVLPLTNLKRLPHAPVGVAGLFDYRGTTIPVVDINQMALGWPSARRLSTRILIVECGDGTRLGLIAERANEMLKREAGDFVESGVAVEDAPYLGPITRDSHGLVQWIHPQELLSAKVREALFHGAAEAA